jgi:hypothetical protein
MRHDLPVPAKRSGAVGHAADALLSSFPDW